MELGWINVIYRVSWQTGPIEANGKGKYAWVQTGFESQVNLSGESFDLGECFPEETNSTTGSYQAKVNQNSSVWLSMQDSVLSRCQEKQVTT